MSERVWCVPASSVLEAADGRPFWRWTSEARNEAFLAELNQDGRFQPRSEVETDETWRQVIPYILLRSPAGGYFTYRRLPASGESRLVDLHSLGVGGHINDEHLLPGLSWGSKSLGPNLIADGLQRELTEELSLPSAELGTLRLHGFLALADTPVDRVHLGVVVILALCEEAVVGCNVRERDKLRAVGWHRPAELVELAARVPFEGWSRTLIEAGLPGGARRETEQ